MKGLRPNIGRQGRWMRGLAGLGLLAAGSSLTLAAAGPWVWVGLGSIGLGLFALFEAARGWCLARACGIKTRF